MVNRNAVMEKEVKSMVVMICFGDKRRTSALL